MTAPNQKALLANNSDRRALGDIVNLEVWSKLGCQRQQGRQFQHSGKFNKNIPCINLKDCLPEELLNRV